jgi:predicted metal-dependent phosphoesterase TrpH
MCTVPVMNRYCRESYNDPEAVYEKLKRLGMDLVTVTDHDSIDVIDVLGNKPDFFLSEEVTCRMPSGTEAHIGVYGINERQHIEIQRRRNDLPSFLAYLKEQDLIFSLNHPFSGLTGKRHSSDINWFSSVFPAIEALNGHLLPENNSLAVELAQMLSMTAIGGSDGHTMRTIGLAYTEVSGATTSEEFFAGLRANRAKAHGQHGNYFKLTRDIFSVGFSMIREHPPAAVMLPLALAIPLVTGINHFLELKFARTWRRALTNGKVRGGLSAPQTPFNSEALP